MNIADIVMNFMINKKGDFSLFLFQKKSVYLIYVQWSTTDRVNNHLDFDYILEDESLCKKLERMLIDYMAINKLTENDILV